MDVTTPELPYEKLWVPQDGSQVLFLESDAFEVLLSGSRGSGKTDCTIFDFIKDVGKGYGPAWRGIIFRRTYKQLEDIVSRTHRWFRVAFENSCDWNGTEFRWTFKDGEILYLRYIDRVQDYYHYHGWEIPWIAWEELSNWPSSDCYDMVKTICRSSDRNIPKRYRANTNPFGVGYNWVKDYFIDPAPFGTVITSESGQTKQAFDSSVLENRKLILSDPNYLKILQGVSDPNKRAAWLLGSWDIVAGGAIGDLWSPNIHIMKPFRIPHSWKVDRSMDWGSTKPYSIGFWAQADGFPVELDDGSIHTFPRGSLFLIDEIYGYDGEANKGTKESPAEVANLVMEKVDSIGRKVHHGPADTQIWNGDRGETIADEMRKATNGRVKWQRAVKGAGSRAAGLQRIRDYLQASLDFPRMEKPGMFVFSNCMHWRRTVPIIPRDELKMDETDKNSEDHCFDMTMYKVATRRRALSTTTEI